MKVAVQQTGAFVYNRAFGRFLNTHRLTDVDRIIEMNGDKVVKKAIKERTVLMFTVGQTGQERTLYLKKYVHTLAASFFSSNALDEFRALCDFHQEDIPTLTPVCAGRKQYFLSGDTSFLITEALTGTEPADRIASSRFDAEMVTKLAQLVKKMHGCGFIHKDLYLCHVLVDDTDRLFIVDLHRVKRFKHPPMRLIVKDIAALNYSADEIHIKTAYKIRFLKQYLSIDRLNPQTKRFIRRVIKKTEKMKKHNRKKNI